MNIEKLELLTNKFIDNELSESEKEELEILLENIANKEYFESMISMIKKIESISTNVEAPDITKSVMNQIKPKGENIKMRNRFKWVAEIFNGQRIGYGISFALGAVLVAVITILSVPQQNINDDFLSGTFADRNFDETFYIDRHPLNGEVKIKYSKDIVTLDISMNSEKLVNCELNYDTNALAFYGVKSIKPGTASKFTTSRNGVYLSDIESDHYLVFLRVLKQTESNISAKFYEGLSEIQNISIKVNN